MCAFEPKIAKASRLRPLLGTFVAVEAEAASAEETVAGAVDAAFSAICRVDELMHPRRAGSDLARLATASPGTPVAVDAWTREILALAAALGRETGGRFDPCLPSEPGRITDLEIRAEEIVCHRRVALDLGGIAKGFAVDRAVEAMRARGCEAGLVNAGGDLRVFGTKPRAVSMRTPDGRALLVELREQALAVSGPRTADSPAEHRGFYAGDTRAWVDGRFIAIAAPTAALADALCKSALLCEPARVIELLASHGARQLEVPPVS